MIPKVIHYCWFGSKSKPKSVSKCISTWEKYLPDYEIREWNEKSFDVNSMLFTKEAYSSKKYAFVADYVRLYALYTEGGIYFDTDVEVLRNFDDMLDKPAFIGYESLNIIGTAVIGATKGSLFIKELLDYYEETHFDIKLLVANTQIVSDILKNHGVDLNNKCAILKDYLYIYSLDYFIVKSFYEFEYYFSENSYSIHHCNASWFSLLGRLRLIILSKIGKKGRKMYFRIAHMIKNRI